MQTAGYYLKEDLSGISVGPPGHQTGMYVDIETQSAFDTQPKVMSEVYSNENSEMLPAKVLLNIERTVIFLLKYNNTWKMTNISCV